MRKQYFVDLPLYGILTVDPRAHYVAGDRLVYPLYINLSGQTDEPFDIPENAAANLNFRHEDGTSYPRMAEILDHKRGQLLYNMDETDTARPGAVTVTLTLTYGEKRLTWPEFRFVVKKNDSFDGSVEPPDFLLPWRHEIEAKLSRHESRISGLEQEWDADPGYEILMVPNVPKYPYY